MFVGREAAIAEVVRLLRRGALVTLSGPAGAGKTRLALEVAARQRERFRDGAWFVDLAPLARPELIADAIAAATGLTQSGRSPSAAALVDWLAGRELLIVLDNCEHLIAGCAETVERVLRGCPAVQVLATSREPLALTGELVWRVPSLTLPDATRLLSPAELLGYESVRLFVERARAVQPQFALTEANAGDVVGICRRLDGMPLAIELAAARAGSLPPAEIARRLVASFGLLRHQRRTVQTRQQTLEAALEWSYRLLEAPEARLLGRLGVFAGRFGLEAAEQICSDRGLPREEIVDLLAHLVDKSLVVASEDAGEPRYRLLEMIRQYARERLAEHEEPAALSERHARWYAELAQDPRCDRGRRGGPAAAPAAAGSRSGRRPCRAELAVGPRPGSRARAGHRARRLVAAAGAVRGGAGVAAWCRGPHPAVDTGCGRSAPARRAACPARRRSATAATGWPSAARRSTTPSATMGASPLRCTCGRRTTGCAGASRTRAGMA